MAATATLVAFASTAAFAIAVSATAAFTVSVATTFAITVTAATTASVAVSATAATTMMTVHLVEELFDFFFGSFARFVNATCELQILACQWMIEVYLYRVVRNLQDTGNETLSVLVLQRKNCIYKHILRIECSIAGEYLLVQQKHLLCIVRTVGLLLRKRKSEVSTCIQINDCIFKCRQSHFTASVKFHRTRVLRLFYKLFFTVFYTI